MSSNKRILAVVGIVAITMTILVGSLRSKAQTQLTQDFQQTYPFSANGRISLENINGDVRVAAWDRNEVMVHAVKRAYRQERLDEVTIDIDATADSLRIKSEYPHRNQNIYNKGERKFENPAEVVRPGDERTQFPRGRPQRSAANGSRGPGLMVGRPWAWSWSTLTLIGTNEALPDATAGPSASKPSRS